MTSTAAVADPYVGLTDDGIPVALAPPEIRRTARDDVPMLVTTPDSDEHRHLEDLRTLLRPGDLLVVNDSPTLPAALGVVDPTSGEPLAIHVAGPAPRGAAHGGDARHLALVEVRTPRGVGTGPRWRPPAVAHTGGLPLADDPALRVRLGSPWPARSPGPADTVAGDPPASRCWLASLDAPVSRPPSWHATLTRHGRPIRYAADVQPLPLADLQTVFAAPVGTRPAVAGDLGSAEMPSAGRPFTSRLVGALGMAGVRFATVTLHCGISSQELGEPPLPEACRVPASTLDAIGRTRLAGGRVVAVGTTVVRALATAEHHGGPFTGTTDVLVGPEDRPGLVDGLLSGFHEPEASHRDLLAAIVGQDVLDRAYRAAADGPYLWHELGDVHLLLTKPFGAISHHPARPRRPTRARTNRR